MAKSKPMRSSVSKIADQSPIALGSRASYSLVTLNAESSNWDLTGAGRPVARGLHENAASSLQVSHPDVKTNTSTVRLVAETTKKPIGTKFSPHNLKISRNNVGHLEKVCSNGRQKLGRQSGDDMSDNAMIWGMFMSATKKAAVHLGQSYQENLCTTKNTNFEKVKQLSEMSQNQSAEIFGTSTVNVLQHNSMGEKYFVERWIRQAVECKGKRFL